MPRPSFAIELDEEEVDTLMDAIETAVETGLVFAVDAQSIVDKLLAAGWEGR